MQASTKYQELLAETRELESEYSEVLGREQVLINRMNLLEKENIRLEQDMVRMTDRETDPNNAILTLKENMTFMERELESSMRIARDWKTVWSRWSTEMRRLGLTEPPPPILPTGINPIL